MRKHITAFFAALLITVVVGLGMFVIGGNAALNKDGLPVLNSPVTSRTSNVSLNSQSQVEQLQNLVAQYQQREQQYQNELSAAQQQLDQASGTLQQYQELFQFLVQRGVIQVDQNGRVIVR